MKFTEALLSFPEVAIFQIEIEPDEYYEFDKPDEKEDFDYWDAAPINADILSAEFVRDKILDGYFVLKALFIPNEGELRSCYIDVTMPERISERVFFKIENQIKSKYHAYLEGKQLKGKIIPIAAIDGFGLYELFYSKKNPEIGLEVLRNGLKISKRKKYIALDLAYILRDENRYEEAIEAFSIAITEGADNEYCFIERAGLFEKIGDRENAEKDKSSAKEFISNRLKRR
jgi:tetratricopeptide (TPR) repeat protein